MHVLTVIKWNKYEHEPITSICLGKLFDELRTPNDASGRQVSIYSVFSIIRHALFAETSTTKANP